MGITTVELLRLAHVVTYLIVTSQLLFYLVVLGDALKLVSIQNFLEQRKAVDALMQKRFQMIYYACILLSILMVVLSASQLRSPFFISSVIALVCLIIDVTTSLKGNTPINKLVNSYRPGDTGTDWEMVRLKWLRLIRFRGIFSLAGMLSLLIALVID